MDTHILEVHLLAEQNKFELRMARCNLAAIREILEQQAGLALEKPVSADSGLPVVPNTADQDTEEIVQRIRLTGNVYEDSLEGSDALIERIRSRFDEEALQIYVI